MGKKTQGPIGGLDTFNQAYFLKYLNERVTKLEKDMLVLKELLDKIYHILERKK